MCVWLTGSPARNLGQSRLQCNISALNRTIKLIFGKSMYPCVLQLRRLCGIDLFSAYREKHVSSAIFIQILRKLLIFVIFITTEVDGRIHFRITGAHHCCASLCEIGMYNLCSMGQKRQESWDFWAIWLTSAKKLNLCSSCLIICFRNPKLLLCPFFRNTNNIGEVSFCLVTIHSWRLGEVVGKWLDTGK